MAGVLASAIHRCLADPTRLRLLHLLARRSLCVCHFEAVLGLPQAKISRHLSYLRRHGLVACSRRRAWRIYALSQPTPALLAANLACLQERTTAEPLLRRDLARLDHLAQRVDCDCAVPDVPRRRLLRLAR